MIKRISVGVLVALILAVLVATGHTQATYATRDLEIELGADFTTQAQLTIPAAGEDPFPTLILFHGSGPYDMDASYFITFGAEPISTNFKRLAEELAAQGIAVLRFNKRGVLGNGEYDFAQIQASTLDRLVEDADAVIAAALEQAEVDSERLYLYGWSEGAWVAANAAKNQPAAVAGLVLQGAPNGDLASILPYQYLDNALPYLAADIDADGDSQLAMAEIQTIPAGYPVSLMAQFFFYEPGTDLSSPKINTFVDANGDSLIDLEGELRPAIETYIGNYAQFMPEQAANTQTAELVAKLGIPTLLVHGELDGWVPVSSAQAIAEAASDVVTLKVYEGLGHALSPVESVVFDTFNAMADEPIADIAAWILAR